MLRTLEPGHSPSNGFSPEICADRRRVRVAGTGVRKPSRGPNAGVRYDGRRKIWLDGNNKEATPVKKTTKRKRGNKDGDKEEEEEETEGGPWTEGQFLKTCVVNCMETLVKKTW
jgi:hypothetical protein